MPILSLSLGSNIDAANNIRLAVEALRENFNHVRCSTVFESEAVGFDGDNFLNLVATLETDSELQSISEFLKRLEDDLGRDRSQPRYSSRTIDIDILTYGEQDGCACGIVLPRPEITRNAFVLRPLAELMPSVVHKGTGLSYSRLWEEYDQTSQKLWPAIFDWGDTFDD